MLNVASIDRNYWTACSAINIEADVQFFISPAGVSVSFFLLEANSWYIF